MFDSMPPAVPTRDRLIQAAADLMMRQSYSTVSVDDICKAADIKKGTFYHHFPSKVELGLAAFDNIWAEGRAEFLACISNTALTPEERLAEFAASMTDFHRETYRLEGKVYGCPLCNAGSEMGAQDETIRCKMQALFDDAVDLFATLVAEMPTQRQSTRAQCLDVARAMMCFMMGVEYQAKVANDPEVLARDLLPGFKRILSSAQPE